VSTFRDLIEGGIRRPSLITLFGEPGTSKVFIAIDFIFEGLKHDQNCIYICRDHPVESVRRSMKVFGDIEGYEKDGKLIFVDAFTGRFGQSKGEYFVEDPYDLCLYNGLLSLLSRNEKIDRLVFDSVSVIIAKPEDAVRLLKRFHGFIEESNCLGLFIGVEGGLYKELEVMLSSSSDVSLRTYRKGNENFIRLERMRARPHNHPEAKVVVGKEGVKMYRI
jgi:KaiC/GvpD/RAD55 family RecA-like ATPase